MADDRNRAKFEAFIIKFQAGENKRVFRKRVSPSVSLLCSSSSSACRSYLARKKYKELMVEKNRAATKIQARYRGHKERRTFRRRR